MEPRLVLLSRGPELYSTRRLATEAERGGWMVDIIDPLALTIVVDDDGGRVFHKGWPVECEAVLPRIGYSITRRGVAIVRQFEQTGVIVLNSSQGILRSRDKLVACQMMAEARFTQDMDGIAPFLGVSLIWNSFSASGGSGPAPREYDYTPLLSVGFNFSNDLLYGMVAMQGERDKKTTQFYIGFRF